MEKGAYPIDATLGTPCQPVVDHSRTLFLSQIEPESVDGEVEDVRRVLDQPSSSSVDLGVTRIGKVKETENVAHGVFVGTEEEVTGLEVESAAIASASLGARWS